MNAPLRYLAARFALGTLSADEIKATIDDLVREGFYVDACIDALNSFPAQMAEVSPAFLAALGHYAIELPNTHDAVQCLIERHLFRIAAREIEPLEGLSEMIAEVYWDYDVSTSAKKYVGDSYGIEQLVSLHWAAGDLRERQEEISCNGKYGPEAWGELEKTVRTEAERWLATRAR